MDFFQQKQDYVYLFSQYILLFILSSDRRNIYCSNWNLTEGFSCFFKWSFKRQERAPTNQESSTQLNNHNSLHKYVIVLYLVHLVHSTVVMPFFFSIQEPSYLE